MQRNGLPKGTRELSLHVVAPSPYGRTTIALWEHTLGPDDELFIDGDSVRVYFESGDIVVYPLRYLARATVVAKEAPDGAEDATQPQT